MCTLLLVERIIKVSAFCYINVKCKRIDAMDHGKVLRFYETLFIQRLPEAFERILKAKETDDDRFAVTEQTVCERSIKSSRERSETGNEVMIRSR